MLKPVASAATTRGFYTSPFCFSADSARIPTLVPIGSGAPARETASPRARGPAAERLCDIFPG